MREKLTHRIRNRYEFFRAKRIVQKKQNDGLQSVYHFHVIKAAGTSINQAFMRLHGKPDEVLPAIYRAPLHTFRAAGGVLTSGRYFIEKGAFTYGFSHFPFHTISLPENTFTFTCLRHPFDRLFSRYRELKASSSHPLFQKTYPEKLEWLSGDFAHFVRSATPAEVSHTLALFSEKMNRDEAFERICGLDFYFFTEKFKEGLEILADLTGRPLEFLKVNQSPKTAEIAPALRQEIEEKYLKNDLWLYNRLLEKYEGNKR